MESLQIGTVLNFAILGRWILLNILICCCSSSSFFKNTIACGICYLISWMFIIFVVLLLQATNSQSWIPFFSYFCRKTKQKAKTSKYTIKQAFLTHPTDSGHIFEISRAARNSCIVLFTKVLNWGVSLVALYSYFYIMFWWHKIRFKWS